MDGVRIYFRMDRRDRLRIFVHFNHAPTDRDSNLSFGFGDRRRRHSTFFGDVRIFRGIGSMLIVFVRSFGRFFDQMPEGSKSQGTRFGVVRRSRTFMRTSVYVFSSFVLVSGRRRLFAVRTIRPIPNALSFRYQSMFIAMRESNPSVYAQLLIQRMRF